MVDSVSGASSMLLGGFMDPDSSFSSSSSSANPYEPYEDANNQMFTSFTSPAENNEIQFITILFVIEHIFLLLFMFLREFLIKQTNDADILLERRHIKRGIKKYFKQRNIIAENMRTSVLVDIVAKNRQAHEFKIEESFVPDLFVNLFESTLDSNKARSTLDSEKAGKQE